MYKNENRVKMKRRWREGEGRRNEKHIWNCYAAVGREKKLGLIIISFFYSWDWIGLRCNDLRDWAFSFTICVVW